MGYDFDIPEIYTVDTHDIFFYDGQRFHQTISAWVATTPTFSLRPLVLTLDGECKKWYFCMEQEDGLRGPIGFCMTGCPGHDTSEEACSHYGKYLFEMITLGIYLPVLQKWGYCAVCKKMTRGYAEIESPYYQQQWFLCDIHRSAETLKKRFCYIITPEFIQLVIEPYARYQKKEKSKNVC